MKKTLALLIAFAMAFALAACGKTEEPVNNTQAAPAAPAETVSEEQPQSEVANIPNPVVPAESVNAINEFLGCNLVKPGVMGVNDESYFVISEKIGEYNFNVGGIPYTFRFSTDTEDISGIYNADGSLLISAEDGVAVSADGYTGARWFAEEGQYCLTTGGEIELETFQGIVDELMSIQGLGSTDVAELPAEEIVHDPLENQSWYDNLAGTWQDSYSGRATMEIESVPGAALINVYWGDSASCTYEWTMNVTMEEAAEDGTNKLTYTDCTERKVDNDGTTETVTVLYENGEGYFTLNQGGFLLWDGAADENCTECVFEQIVSGTPLQ